MRRFHFIALCALCALALFASSATADISIAYSTDGGATYTTVATSSGNLVSTGASFVPAGDFNFSLSASDNVPGTTGAATEFNDTLAVQNASSGTSTLYLQIVASGFTNPLAPPTATLDGSLSGLYVNNSTITPGTDLLQMVSTVSDGTHSYSATATPTITLAGITADTGEASVPVLNSNYSMTQTIQITLAAGEQVQLIGNSVLTPEPASLLAWGCGLGLIGLVRHRRRKATIA